MITALTLTPLSGVVNYPVGTLYQIPGSAVVAIGSNYAVTFPAPWASVSAVPGIEISVTNNSVSAPIAPILMDKWVSSVDSTTYYYPMAELTTVQPGATVTETVDGLPVTQMVLALPYLAIENTDVLAGFNVVVQAWAV